MNIHLHPSAQSDQNRERPFKKEVKKNTSFIRQENQKKKSPITQPKILSANLEKKNSMINNAILISTEAGFVERTRVKNSELDLSKFNSLVRVSCDT